MIVISQLATLRYPVKDLPGVTSGLPNKNCVHMLTMMDGFVMTISYIMQRNLDMAVVNVTCNIALI